MRLARLVPVLLLVFALLLSTAWAADKPQTNCPVMGGKINKDIYSDYEGKRVYFCCESCISPFKKDPAKYIKQLEDEGVTLETVSTGGHDHDHDHDKHSTGK